MKHIIFTMTLVFLPIQLSWGQNGWVKVGNVVRLSISTDNVGIGTASPGVKLHIENSGAASVLIRSTNGGGFIEFERSVIAANAGFQFHTGAARKWFLGMPATTR